MSFLGLAPVDDPALIEAATGETSSFRRLLAEADDLRGSLPDGKRLVFLLCRNDRFSVVAYLALQLAGHAVALLDGTRPIAEHAGTLDDYRPDVIVGPTGTADALRAEARPVGRAERALGGELVSLATSPGDPPHPDLALLLGTSGTTGSSKYVRLSQRSVQANARSIAEYVGLDRAERPITALPLHYSFGLSVLNSHWLAGAAVVLTSESVLQKPFWAAVEEHGCTSIAGVPYTYRLLERIGYRDMALPRLATMQQAGGALERSLTEVYARHMAAKGGRLFVMYGQTEATARIAYVPPERLADKLGSAGQAIPGGRLSIEPLEGLPPDEPPGGEIVYEGPNVMLGYAHGREDLGKGDELGGVLHTGDIGYLDEEGFLFLTGRSKRIAKVFGLRVNLDEVERLLREHGAAAVVAEDDRIWGFCAFGSDDSANELKGSLSRRLHLHPSALEIRHVDDLPVTSAGKIDYRAVERWMRTEP